jgi:hypothetical protein
MRYSLPLGATLDTYWVIPFRKNVRRKLVVGGFKETIMQAPRRPVLTFRGPGANLKARAL